MNTCETKQEELKKLFDACSNQQDRYELIITLGKKLPSMNPLHKIEKNLVAGCQSRLYVHAVFSENKLLFEADSDALISKGLAAILLFLYNGEAPEIILKNPPTILAELNIFKEISPVRAQGLKSLYLKMQKIALDSLL
jgi:cysteine desulfuration protein SufE